MNGRKRVLRVRGMNTMRCVQEKFLQKIWKG